MNADYTQEGFDQLQKYLDGELADAQQSSFFAQLSLNENLRRDFNIMTQTRERLRADVIPPPSYVESGVISGLKPIAAGMASSALWKAGIAGACIATVSTVLLLWFVWQGPLAASQAKNVDLSTQLDYTKRSVAVEHEAALKTQILLNESQNAARLANESLRTSQQNEARSRRTMLASTSINATLAAQKQKRAEDVLARTVTASDRANATSQLGNTNSLNESNRSTRLDASSSTVSSRAPSSSVVAPPSGIIQSDNALTAHSGSTPAETHQTLPSETHSNSGTTLQDMSQSSASLVTEISRTLSLEFRSFSMRSNPNLTLPGLVNPPINNFGFTLMRDWSTEQTLGLELGQESILQHYSTSISGKPVNIDQNYLAWWAGLMYQYSPTWLRYGELQPFGRFTFGGTRIGPTARVLLGARLHIIDSFSVMLSGEAMQLFSRQDGTAVTSSKYGISGGIAIHF